MKKKQGTFGLMKHVYNIPDKEFKQRFLTLYQ